jgi:hypothetical protein
VLGTFCYDIVLLSYKWVVHGNGIDWAGPSVSMDFQEFLL